VEVFYVRESRCQGRLPAVGLALTKYGIV